MSPPQPPRGPERKARYLWLAAIAAALIPGIVLAIFYSRMIETNESLAAQVRRLETTNAELTKANTELESRLERQGSAAAQGLEAESETPTGANSGNGYNGSIPATGSRVELVPYGEVPLAGARVEALRAMIAELQEQSFRGVIEVRPSAGRFCLSGSQQEGYSLAAADLAAIRCDLIGNPFADALGPAEQQSLAFANLVGGLRRDPDAPIKVDVVPGSGEPVVAYPVSIADVTAGAWNQVAARNNRVEFRAVAAR